MDALIDQLAVYLYLARASARRSRYMVSVRMYFLAGHLALHGPWPTVAAYCREKILQINPHHLVSRWPDLQTARLQPDYISLLELLHRRYPLERAELLLRSLGIDRAEERSCYDSDLEYAASILGLTADELNRRFPPPSDFPPRTSESA